jgi:GC-rich sequence DNA-binding factor
MEQTDELGRTTPNPNPADEQRQRRMSRVARRQLRTSKRTKAVEVEDGYSTDSSLAPHDASAYSSALQSLGSRKKEVLADVRAEEFRDPGKGKWSVWREKYSDSYVGAWGGLGVVSVWEFWVRLEGVAWNCIEVRDFVHWGEKINLTALSFRINVICTILNGIKAFMNIVGLGRVPLKTEN